MACVRASGNGNSIAYVATRDIAAGEELAVAYGREDKNVDDNDNVSVSMSGGRSKTLLRIIMCCRSFASFSEENILPIFVVVAANLMNS